MLKDTLNIVRSGCVVFAEEKEKDKFIIINRKWIDHVVKLNFNITSKKDMKNILERKIRTRKAANKRK